MSIPIQENTCCWRWCSCIYPNLKDVKKTEEPQKMFYKTPKPSFSEKSEDKIEVNKKNPKRATKLTGDELLVAREILQTSKTKSQEKK